MKFGLGEVTLPQEKFDQHHHIEDRLTTYTSEVQFDEINSRITEEPENEPSFMGSTGQFSENPLISEQSEVEEL